MLFERFDSQELRLTILTYVERKVPTDFNESTKNYDTCVCFWKLHIKSNSVKLLLLRFGVMLKWNITFPLQKNCW